MSTIYDYDRPVEPVLFHKESNPDPPPDYFESGIQPDVLASEMTNKTIEWCRWDEDTELLEISFTDALDAGDKTILDGIVASN